MALLMIRKRYQTAICLFFRPAIISRLAFATLGTDKVRISIVNIAYK